VDFADRVDLAFRGGSELNRRKVDKSSAGVDTYAQFCYSGRSSGEVKRRR
jgi:hypothetical protein